MPLGALLFIAQLRGGSATRTAALRAVAAGTLLSLAMETLQNFLPPRVPSNVDLVLNALGSRARRRWSPRIAHLNGGIERWQATRDRWFIARSAGGLALLCLWPVGAAVPDRRCRSASARCSTGCARGWRCCWHGTSAETFTQGWADRPPPVAALSPSGEFALIVLGLLAPCLVAFTIAAPAGAAWCWCRARR